jgi:hypothetical protein
MARRMDLQKEDVPHHFEAVSLRPVLQLAGWPVALVSAASGVIAAARAPGPLVEASGVLLVVLGSVLIMGLIRCRRFETVVTRKLVSAGAGPLRQSVPVSFVERAEEREASSWRLLYARREVVLEIGYDARRLVVPSVDPGQLIAAVLEVQHLG